MARDQGQAQPVRCLPKASLQALFCIAKVRQEPSEMRGFQAKLAQFRMERP